MQCAHQCAQTRSENHHRQLEGIPPNMIAEIDMAQDHAEIQQADLVTRVESFLRGDFGAYDNDYRQYRGEVPPDRAVVQPPDTSADEVAGWAALFASQNYAVAADRFEECWDVARQANVVEMAAFHGWNLAKALYLQSLLGDANARDRALQVFGRPSLVAG
jgi:hypothetical protein